MSKARIEGGRVGRGASHPRAQRHWTEGEIRLLRAEWGNTTPRVIAKRLGRTTKAVVQYADRALGLPMGIPQGHITLTQAGEIYGFTMAVTRAILAKAGVKVRAWITRNKWRTPLEKKEAAALRMAGKKTGVRSVRRFADEAEVERAMRDHLAWMDTTETVAEAAARFGIPRLTMLRWAKRSGVVRDENVWSEKRYIRLPSWAWNHLVSLNGHRCTSLKRAA